MSREFSRTSPDPTGEEPPPDGADPPPGIDEPDAPADAAEAERTSVDSDQAVEDADEDEDRHVIDLVPDVLALARSQLDAGLHGMAEGTVRRRLARLEADAVAEAVEPDALRVLLAEALWRQGRVVAARQALDGIRAGSPQRRLPMAMLVEAELLAAMGERDRAVGAMERVVSAIGVDAAYELRGDLPGTLAWPLPAFLAPSTPAPARAPWAAGPAAAEREQPAEVDDDRVAAARSRVEEARVAYVAGELVRGDEELSLATRLDP